MSVFSSLITNLMASFPPNRRCGEERGKGSASLRQRGTVCDALRSPNSHEAGLPQLQREREAKAVAYGQAGNAVHRTQELIRWPRYSCGSDCCGSAARYWPASRKMVRRRFDSEDQGSHRVLIFSRTPISPPSSSVKCIPACSRAFCILRMVEKFPFTVPSFCSIRRKVARPIPALRESLSWLQPRSARAARI